MPNVGGVDYPYTPEGITAAKKAAHARGESLPGEEIQKLYYGGYINPSLPSGFRQVVGGHYTAHPAVSSQLPGSTLAEKAALWQQKEAAAAPQQVSIAPSISSGSINLAALEGSSPLTNIALDPFAFTPDPNVEIPTIFSQGGPVMPGLGFRPLGYSSGGILDQSNLGAVSTGDLGAVSTAPVSQNAPDTLEYQFLRAVEEGPDIALAFARTYKDELSSMVQNNAFDRAASAQIFMQMLSSGALEGGPIGAGMDMPYALPKSESIPPAEQDLPPYLNPSNEDLRSSPGDYEYVNERMEPVGTLIDWRGHGAPWPTPDWKMAPTTTEKVVESVLDTIPLEEMGDLYRTVARSGVPVDRTEPAAGYPGLQAGGYVDHGTVAGKLGRRGRLPVQKAGENLYERRKQLEEEQGKEEQGTGTDLATSHKAPNWYALMGKRPTLGPRRRA